MTAFVVAASMALGGMVADAYSPEALANQIHNLPGLDGAPDFNMFSGYIPVGPGKEMFFWFVESQNKPASDPLLLWTNGGPGCSGLSGFLSEQGPFVPTINGDKLAANPWSWNKISNMVFIEQPVGVGFSTTTTANQKYGDEQAAEDMHTFIVGFFKRFSDFRNNDFYITSESYGGHYMPTLARSIIKHNDVPNFRGVKLGNPITYMPWRTYGEYGTYYGHQLVPKHLWDQWSSRNCFKNENQEVQQCQEAQSAMDNIVAGLDPYALDFPTCMDGAKQAKRAERHHILRMMKGTNHPAVYAYQPCLSSWGGAYLNRADVRAAIHVVPGAAYWSQCSDKVHANYNVTDFTEVNMMPVWQWILANSDSSHKYLIFSGDDDSVCATMGTQQFIWDMGYTVKVNWEAWSVASQVAGYRTVWNTKTGAKWSLTTVHGAGHMVPQTQGERSMALLESFLSGKLFE